MASITNFRSWFRSRNQPQVFQNLFYSLSNAFSKTSLSDKQAIEEGYLSNDVWYSVVSNIAENVSSLPIALYEKDAKGELTKITSGEIFEQIFDPNADQTFRELLEEQAIFLCNTGEAYFFTPVRSTGLIESGGRRRGGEKGAIEDESEDEPDGVWAPTRVEAVEMFQSMITVLKKNYFIFNHSITISASLSPSH